MNVTFGCSHTTWTGISDTFTNAAVGGTGFFQTVEIARRFAARTIPDNLLCCPETIERVVLQKPMINRYPWYCKDNKFDVKTARENFNGLPIFAKKMLLHQIYKAEEKLLREFVSLFPGSKIAVWTYWYDYYVFASSLFISYIDQFLKLAEDLGVTNLGTIIDGKPIIDEALKHGSVYRQDTTTPHEEVIGFLKSIVDQGWIIATNDGHSTLKHNLIVDKRIKEWVCSI